MLLRVKNVSEKKKSCKGNQNTYFQRLFPRKSGLLCDAKQQYATATEVLFARHAKKNTDTHL
jgi:hypothetical protein